MSNPTAKNPDSWPVFWRVTAPAAGSYARDMVLIETSSETEARAYHRGFVRGGWPVRLERISAGPLPKGAEARLDELLKANEQNPNATLGALSAAWEARPN